MTFACRFPVNSIGLYMVLKSSLVITLILITSFVANGQSRFDGNQDSQGRRTGVWKKYYGNRLESETNYKSGLREGSHKDFWRSGYVYQVGQYASDKRVGQWTLYHDETTQIKEQGRYLNGLKSGSWKYYTKKGTLRSVTNYLAGKKSGLYESFWKANVPDEKGNYLEGKKIGDWIKYDYKRETNESFLRYKGTYGKGEIKTGRWEEYRYLTDNLKKVETFNDAGVLNGPYEEYDYSNRLIAKGDMRLGKRNGTWSLRENDGEYKKTITYSDGIKNGPYEKQTRFNKLIDKGSFQNDQKSGYWEETDNSGIKNKGKYSADKKVGKWEVFHPEVTTHPVIVLEFSPEGLELTRRQYNQENSLLMEVTYNAVDGSRSYKSYYPDATLKADGKIVNEKQQGPWKDYFPDGTVAVFKNYSNGVMTGEFI